MCVEVEVHFFLHTRCVELCMWVSVADRVMPCISNSDILSALSFALGCIIRKLGPAANSVGSDIFRIAVALLSGPAGIQSEVACLVVNRCHVFVLADGTSKLLSPTAS